LYFVEIEDRENRINMRVTAELEGFGVTMCTNDNVITNIQINGKIRMFFPAQFRKNNKLQQGGTL
jgi:hypothetical protein